MVLIRLFDYVVWNNDVQDTTTGETLCVKDEPIILEKMDFPDPVIKVRCNYMRSDTCVWCLVTKKGVLSQTELTCTNEGTN